MQPYKNNILHFIYRATQYFQIPDFQRPYTWDSVIVETFLQDLEHVRASSRNHYFGTVVYVSEGDHFTVIDGQQRLTTTLLMLVAIYHIVREFPEKSSIPAQQIKDQYLYDQYGAPDKERKILLRTVTTDNEVFKKIFEGQSLTSDEAANRQKKAYDQFKHYFQQHDHLETYIRVLERFEIITVSIDTNDDNPQLIFESINSTGAPLSSGDKIRNYSLMLNSESARRHVYDHYWSKIEKTLTRYESKTQIDDITGFYRHFLQCKAGENCTEAHTYNRFKVFFNSTVGHNHDLDHLKSYYEDLLTYLNAYLFIVYGDDPHGHFTAFKEYNFRFQFLEFSPRISFLMDVLVEYSRGIITKQEVNGTYRAIEVFIVRRLMCNMGTPGMNNLLPTWFKQVKRLQAKYPSYAFDDVLRRFILDGKGRTRVFPNDAEVRSAIENYPMGTYANRNITYFLSCIEDSIQPNESCLLSQIRKREINVSIEHIMPQTLTDKWKINLGSNAETIHKTWLNRISNLTLTGYNSTYSNKSFATKKTCRNGFGNSPLNINRHIAEYDDWNEVRLKQRETWLSDHILLAWPALSSSLNSNNELHFGRYALGDEIDIEGTKPARVEISAESFDVSTWKQFTEVICKYLHKSDAILFERLVSDDAFIRANGDRLVSESPIGLRRSSQIAPNIFIEVNLSANTLRDLAQKIAEKFGLVDSIFFELDSRSRSDRGRGDK